MRRLPPLIALLAILAGGCGGGDDDPGRTVTVESGAPVPVVADEYSFDPETIVLRGGGRLEVELDNRGSLAHNLRVFEDGTDIGGTDTFTGGPPRTSAVAGLEPGEYELICTVGDHAALGMTGKLTVR